VELAGKTVLITGASTGIGAATARTMSERGARTALVARSEDKLRELAGGLREARAYPADVSDPAAVAELAARVADELGVPDVVVNNAGAGRWLFIEETDPEEWIRMNQVPYFAAFFVTRAFIERMIDRGSGRIVNVNTPVSALPWPGAVGYGSARWGVRGFTATLRADLRGTGVGVTEIVPAKVSSDYFENNPGAEERIPSVAKVMKTLTPEECGEMIARAVERERREVVFPLLLRLFYIQARLAPRLTEWVLWRTGARRGG
jgi:NADP-dependent 3-hydroxy acid dehydrogenase YdfG